MENHIVPWTSPNGVNLPAHVGQVDDLSAYIKALSKKEVNKIVNAFQAQLYDMATEYAWNRTISILRDKVLSFGKDFVLEMLGRTESQGSVQDDFLSEMDIINLSADLGFINKTAKMQFLHCSEMIMYFSSRDADEEMDVTSAQSCIRNCVNYVLGMDDEKFDFEYSFENFRDKLKDTSLTENDETLNHLLNSPYFYKRTTVRVLLSLMKKTQGAEQEKVFTNMSVVIPKIWADLLADDRRPIGNAYARAVSDSNKSEVKALKSVLLKVKGFDYVPENLRSNTFIEVAQNLLNTHFAMNNFYNEPAAAKKLVSLGSVIPSPAFGICMTSVLACKLGNTYGVSTAAQPHLDAVLKNVSVERWAYYINQVLPADETILYKLASSLSSRKRWLELTQAFGVKDVDGKDKYVVKFINATVAGDTAKLKTAADTFLDQVRP